MDFVEKYNIFLEQNMENIRRSVILHQEDPAYIYFKDKLDHLYHKLPDEKRPELRLSATDGSEFSRELYNGQKLVVSRAISLVDEKEIEETSFNLIRVEREQKNELVKRIMENLEHKAATRSIVEEHAKICLMDGSLSGRLYWGRTRFDTDLSPEIYGEYIKNLSLFLDNVIKNGVTLMFIGKTSDTAVLKRSILEGEKNVPEKARVQNITDHLLVKSIAKYPGYTEPVYIEKSIEKDKTISFYTSHILPSLDDTPLKLDYILPENTEQTCEELVSWIRWAYTGLKNHNLWISLADKKVKFHRTETEDIIMRMFMKTAGIDAVETRGERRARIRF
jgi:hypothetical protein